MRKKLLSIALLLLLFVPLTLGIAAKLSGAALDVSLDGFSARVEKPVWSLSSFLDGSYQTAATDWKEQELRPRGVLTRTYNTVRYTLFDVITPDAQALGKNGDVFEEKYINSELVINGIPDMRDEQSRTEMEEYVRKLSLLQSRLAESGKKLYVVITPSKAHFHRDTIPDKYYGIADPDAVRPVDYFAELIEKSGIPYSRFEELADQLESPPFYSTGIHWSHPFAQLSAAHLLEELAALTGKNYRTVSFGGLKESNEPFWGDADVYELMNLWKKPSGKYFEYDFRTETTPEKKDRLCLLMQGTSFGRWMRSFMQEWFPDCKIFYIDRFNAAVEANNDEKPILSSEDLPVAAYLDQSDAVVIEVLEAELVYYSYGFLEYLLDELETYEPGEPQLDLAARLDMQSDEPWHTDSLSGIYALEAGFAWTMPVCWVELENRQIRESGLELELTVSDLLFRQNKEAVIAVYVNGEKLREEQFTEAWEGTFSIPPEQLPGTGERFEIEICTGAFFVPKELGINDDSKELSCMIRYVGEKR